jgi:hypothetical protein
MGLEGTLSDFSVTDLFQVLALHRKTGTLTIEAREDKVRVSFDAGRIVWADSEASSLEERVGNLLVRTGKLAPGEFLRALECQKDTQQSLGSLLLRDRFVSEQALREALRLQAGRILFAALDWREGSFHFDPAVFPHRDAAMLALAADSVLAEAAQLREERPALVSKVASRDLIFRRVPGVEKLRLVATEGETGEGTLLVSAREAETWKWVDGKRTVGGILDHAFLSEAETYRGLADLIDRSLIVSERVQPVDARLQTRKGAWLSVRVVGLWLIFLLLGASAVREVPNGSWNLLLRPLGERRETAEFLSAVSLARLSVVERAVRMYYDASGRYPRTLDDLLKAGVLDPRMAKDPYGRPYRYILRSEDGKFSLWGRDPRGGIDLNLSFERSLAPVSEAGPSAQSKPADRRPGVEVVR